MARTAIASVNDVKMTVIPFEHTSRFLTDGDCGKVVSYGMEIKRMICGPVAMKALCARVPKNGSTAISREGEGRKKDEEGCSAR
jgi:hypothetical protein